MIKNLLILSEKRLLFFFLLCSFLGFSQSAGFNNGYIVLNNNGTPDKYYKLKDNAADTTNPNFNGANLGTFSAYNGSLILQGSEMNVWKCGGCDITDPKLFYRVYKTAATPGAFSSYDIPFSSDVTNGCSGADQKWKTTAGTVNLLAGLSEGNYTLEVYSRMSTSCSGDQYESNGGSNYKATFSVNPITVVSSGGTNTFATYSTLAAAITAINAGIIHTGTITTYVNAGYAETAPSGGFSITATGTASTPIKFVKNGSGANPTFTASNSLISGSITDAVFKIIGGDYITLDGFTIKENASNTTVTLASNNMTEWGIALLYASTANGAQNNTIQNCTISLNKTYANTFGIYSNTRHSAVAATTTAEVTSAAGSNSNNKIYSNNISNVNYGIVFTGAGTTLSAIDSGNDIGGTSSATGNTISDLGGIIATGSYVSLSGTSYGAITMNQQINDNVSYNSITTGTVTSPITVNGIFKFYNVASPTSGTITSNINNNTVSITNNATANPGNTYSIVGINSQSLTTLSTATFNVNNNTIQNSTLGGSVSTTTNIAGFWLSIAPGVLNVTGNSISNVGITSTASTTGSVYGIYVDSSQSAATANYNNNTISNLYISSSTATSGNVYGIYNTAANTNLSISSNTIKGNTSTATSGSFATITNTAAIVTSIAVNGNFIGDSVTNAITFSKANSGIVYGINNTSAGSASTLSISTNEIRGFSHTIAGTSVYNFINNTGTALSETISSNKFINMNVATTGAIYLINNNYTAPTNGTKTIQNNTVVTGFVRNGGGSNGFYGYYDIGSSTSSTSNIISGNSFSNINTGTSTGSFYGIYSNNYGATIPSLNVYSNTVSNNTTAGAFSGLYVGGFTGTVAVPNRVNDNDVSNNISTSTSISQYGIFVGSVGSYVNTYNNVINANALNAAGQFFGIFGSGTSNNNKFYNNTITNSTSNTTGALGGIYINLGTKMDLYQNAINTFSTTGNIWGIYVGGGTAVNIYDHKNSGTNYSIYGLTSSGASGSVEGIRIAGGTTVAAYQNDINNITTTGATAPITNGFGVSGGATVNIYKNKVYNISSTGSITSNLVNLINGISITGGSTNVYNNTIGAITAPNMNNANSVSGIYMGAVASTAHKIYFNTIYLTASSSGTNFGSFGIYHTYSNTSTTSNLDLRNNIVINKSTPKGTGKTVAFQRSASTNLNNYAATSNNNIFYAGVASANNLIYNDGNNSDQTIVAFQSRVSTRENLSYTEDVTFQSTVPTDANYLRIADGTTTFAESGGAATTSPVVSDDFWGTSRTTYDIGASEFVGVKKAPTITSVSPNPVCVGGTLTIIGTNLNNATAANVKIGGTAVTSITSNDGNTLVVVVGSGTTGTVSVTTNLGTGTSSSSVTISPPPTVTWSASAAAACQNTNAQTTTLNYTATTSSPVSYSITWNASPANSFVAVTDQSNVFASSAGSITINIPAGAVAGTYTGNVTVKNAGGCVSSVSTPFTLTINNSPTDVTLTSTLSPVAADACSLDYVKLEANGGIGSSNGIIGTGTAAASISSYPNPLSAYYGGVKHQMIYLASELTAQGLIAGSSISTAGLYVNAFVANACADLTIRMKNSSSSTLAGFESGTTTVYGATNYTPNATGWVNFTLTTPFIWDGTSNLIVEFVHNAGNSGNGSGTTVRYTTTTGNRTFYGAKDSVAGSIAGFDALTSYDTSGASTSRPNIQFGYSTQKITWTPVDGLYTDVALTTPYLAGTNALTVYAAPTTATSYVAKATLGTCDKTSVSASIVRNKEEYVGSGTDWNTASNWFPAVVPDNTKCAIIPAGKTVAININTAEAKSLTIAETGKVSIAANSSLKVIDAIKIPANSSANDNLVLESNATLMQDNPNPGNVGNIFVKRGTHMRKMDYTYWSAPVTGQRLLNTSGGAGSSTYTTGGFSEGTPNNRIYTYNEPDDKFKGASDAVFLVAKGYAIRGKDGYLVTDPTNNPVVNEFKFVGTPNNGNYFFDIQKSKNTIVGGVEYEHGYNLIGNPYPSQIDFIKFYNLTNGATKNSDVILGKAWFWTNVPGAPVSQNGSAYAPNNYAILSLAGGAPATGVDATETTGSPIPNEFIKVAQGFIVQMRATPPTPTPTVPNPILSGTLKFDNSIRSNNTTGYFYNNKMAENQINRYWVKLVSPYDIVNTILVAHMDEATNGYDPDYDADLLSLGDDSFYSKLNNQKLQIQARNNPLNIDDVVSLGAKYSANGIYKIILGDKEGVFASGQKIYLKDKLTGNLTDLTSQDYIFTANKGIDETRFEIVYKQLEVLASDELKKSNFLVYRDSGYFVIRSSDNLEKVELYDAGGKLIGSKLTSQKEIRWDLTSLPSGVYVLRAYNSGNVRTKKIIK